MNNDALKRALGRKLDGLPLSQKDNRELSRHDKDEAERYLRAVPRVLVRRMTGLTQAKLEATAKRHEIPIDGAVVDFFALLPAVLDALEDEEAVNGSPSLERLRAAKAEHAELDLAKRRGEVVEVAPLQEAMAAMASLGRRRAEAMERAGGAVVRREFEGMLDDWMEAIDRWFPEVGEGEAISETPETGKEKKCK